MSVKKIRFAATLCVLGMLPTMGFAGAPGAADAKNSPDNKTNTEQTEQAASTVTNAPAEMVAQAVQPVETIAGFRVDYTARYAAFKADATLELRVATAPNEYVYEVTTTATGLARLIQSGTAVERSRFAMTTTGIQPVQYAYEDGSGKAEKASRIDFDWSQSIAHGVHEGVSADLDLTPGLLDRLTADLQSILALRSGETPDSQHIAYKNSIRKYDLKLLGEETVTVPAGTFSTLKFFRQRPGSRRASLIWFATDAGYLPIRIEQLKDEKTTITMVATSLSPGTS